MKRSDLIFVAITAFFIVNLAMTNVLAPKIVQVPFLGSLPVSFTTLTYPLTFLVTDIVTEIWGVRRANFIVYLGFGINIFVLALIQAALYATPHEVWVAPENAFGYTTTGEYQTAFASVFSASPSLVFGSMCAYMLAQLTDIRIFKALQRLTNGRHLWLRNNVSTFTSQLIDTAVMCTIFLYYGLGLSADVVFQLATIDYSVKILLALCDTPLCYLAVKFLRRAK